MFSPFFITGLMVFGQFCHNPDDNFNLLFEKGTC